LCMGNSENGSVRYPPQSLASAKEVRFAAQYTAALLNIELLGSRIVGGSSIFPGLFPTDRIPSGSIISVAKVAKHFQRTR
jgi:hypothetical protein